ncbi:element excision factor XisH family protein [Candidatus Entotheonella palauensis]
MPKSDIYHDVVRNALIKDDLLVFDDEMEEITRWLPNRTTRIS